MKRWALPTVVIAAIVTMALAQQPNVRVLTRPKLPTHESLERLGLAFTWYTRIPFDNPLDGIHSVQVLPRGYADDMKAEVFVQTLGGKVYLFDGEHGTLRWSTPVGIPFTTIQPAAQNSQSIILSRREFFYVLNRDTGIHRVYKRVEGGKAFGVRLGSVPTAGASADEELVVFPLRDRAVAFVLPDFEGLAKAREKSPEIIAQEKEGSVQPLEVWKYYDPSLKLNSPAMITGLRVGIVAEDGRLLSLLRENGKARYEYKVAAPVSPMARSGDIAYLGSQDFNQYAFDLVRERVVWRFPAGGPIVQAPEANEVDLFMYAENRGLYRLDKFFGQMYWRAADAEKFLAATYLRDRDGKFVLDKQGRVLAKYVYALDRDEQLLILDGDRGTLLARFDTSAWKVPTVNSWTDRLYLANTDGQLLCLRPRDSFRPQFNRVNYPPQPTAATGPPPEKKEDMDKKEPEKKDDKVGYHRDPKPRNEPRLAATTSFVELAPAPLRLGGE
jgi:outer membrane protein assembly factor BamB